MNPQATTSSSRNNSVRILSLFDIFRGGLANGYRRIARWRRAGCLRKSRAYRIPPRAVPRLEALEPRLLLSHTLLSAGPFYDVTAIATTAQSGVEEGPSINDVGKVAYVATDNNGKEAIIIWDSVTGSKALTPQNLVDSSGEHANFATGVQINNSDRVVAQHGFSTGDSELRLWNAAPLVVDPYEIVASASLVGDLAPFRGLLANPSVNDLDQTAFTATLGADVQLVVPVIQSPGTFFHKTLPAATNPIVSDDGRIVVAALDSEPTLRLYARDLSTFSLITSAGDFKTLGAAPGVTGANANLITFYGDLTTAGANRLSEVNFKAGLLPLHEGPGIFASIAVLAASDVFTAYLPVIGAQNGIGPRVVGVLLALRAAASIAARVGIGAIVRRVGRTRLITAGAAAAAVAFVAMTVTQDVWLLGLLSVAAGFGIGFGQPLSMTLVVQLVPEHARSTALAIRLTGNRIGQVATPAAAGIVAGRAGASSVFWLLGAMLIGSAVAIRSVGPTRDADVPLDPNQELAT